MPRKAEIGATRDSYVYRLRVPAPLKAQWDEHCAKQDKNPSVVMRALMRYIIQDDMPPEVRDWIASQAAGQADDGPKERIEVRFTPTEYQGITTRADAEGCSPHRWIVNCVRASLTREPQFTMETTKALWDSSYQLRAIGRNLNQIAKRLNEGKPANIKTEQIEKLATYIYRHTDKVAAVQDASLSRWLLVTQET
ncbi:plasmid mobilization protein [Proteus mirabilis]|uniref:plasmid mobilization protein n=1 Tax=Proteus mirabilis TaxID=584 RepID=UPI00298CDAB0|nr:plasmid mobilization relaxosome protein MobC [Proteus mirabilis]